MRSRPFRVLLTLTIFVCTLIGCASWSPSMVDATATARTVACTICQATGGPTEQAEAHAEALRVLAEALAALAAKHAPESDVRALLEAMAAKQEEQAKDFEKLVELAGVQ